MDECKGNIFAPFENFSSSGMLLKLLLIISTLAFVVSIIHYSMLTTLRGSISIATHGPFLTYITPFSTSTIAPIFIKKFNLKRKP
jgi:hypothetical protein